MRKHLYNPTIFPPTTSSPGSVTPTALFRICRSFYAYLFVFILSPCFQLICFDLLVNAFCQSTHALVSQVFWPSCKIDKMKERRPNFCQFVRPDIRRIYRPQEAACRQSTFLKYAYIFFFNYYLIFIWLVIIFIISKKLVRTFHASFFENIYNWRICRKEDLFERPGEW